MNDIAAGFGNLKKHAHRRHLSDLRRAASAGSRRRRADALTRSGPPSTRSDGDSAAPLDTKKMASLGIGLVFQDKAGNEHPTADAARAANRAAELAAAELAGAEVDR